MNLGFLDGGTAAHEFGHAIGLGHEHQNPAGGIQWNEPVVLQNLAGPPNNWDEATIRHNVLNKYRRRPDARHPVRPEVDHAVLLSGQLDNATASARRPTR